MLDSDNRNSDENLNVEFYYSKQPRYEGKPFVRIIVPSDKHNSPEKLVDEDIKRRFPRQWLHFQMQHDNNHVIGTPLAEWNAKCPEELTEYQMEELYILKFQTIEQLANATDAQIQRIGMSAQGLRSNAKRYLTLKSQSQSDSKAEYAASEVDELKKIIAEMQIAMSEKSETRKAGRPKKQPEE
jgi:hypothetical protein